MTELSSQQLKAISTQLQKARADLQQQLDIGKSATDIVNLDQSAVGRLSRMDAMQQQSMAISTHAKALKKLRKVERALQAIDQNEYGICRHCDETIAMPRLQAQPEAELCLNCQELQDKQA